MKHKHNMVNAVKYRALYTSADDDDVTRDEFIRLACCTVIVLIKHQKLRAQCCFTII